MEPCNYREPETYFRVELTYKTPETELQVATERTEERIGKNIITVSG